MRRLIKSENRFITRPENDLSHRETISSLFLDGDQCSGRKLELFNVIDGSAEMIDKDIGNIAQFIGDDYRWYITYDCDITDAVPLDMRKVYAISVFGENNEYHGNKMLFLAKRIIARDEKDRVANIQLKNKVSMALFEHLTYIRENRIGWAEVYDDLEACFHKAYPYTEVIDPIDLSIPKRYEDFIISLDGFHYCKEGCDFDSPLYIAYGKL